MRMAFGLHHTNSFDGSSIRHFGRPDEAGALLHYYFGAAAGDPFSRAALGYRHTFGLGVPKSCWTAVSYYKPVAEAVVQEAIEGTKAGPMGSSSGRGLPQIERIRLNVHANQGVKPDRQREVLQYYQYSADRGNTDAQTAVGTLLNIGTHGVNRDHVAAAHYLARAAAAGNDDAMAHLGHMYGAGLGVPQDYAKALKYFQEAATRQNSLGLYGLGYMYLSGKGVDQNHEKAYKYFVAAAEQGDRDAHFYLGAMYMHGLGMKRRSLSKAFMHYFQAASLGHVQAMHNVAIMHMSGKGTPKACKPALSHLKALVEKGPLAAALQAGHEAFFRGQHGQALLSYLQASELGMEIAQSNAAWMLDRGFAYAGPHAAAVATTLFKRSAEQGNVMSLLQLGDCYYYGNGVEQDWVRAAAIYYEAYKERSAEAMFNLGFMHQYGAGVPKDHNLARRFYNMARHSNADAALPVYLATAWLRVHSTWDWLRPHLPQSVVAIGDWLFEAKPKPGAANYNQAYNSKGGGAGSSKADSTVAGVSQQLAPALAPALSQHMSGSQADAESAAAELSNNVAGSTTSSSSSTSGFGLDGDADAEPMRSWYWWLSPQLLVWQWDSLMWRLAEATGLGGFSISSLLEEYSDVGETALLLVLLAVLMIVLRIRRQRQQALENQVLIALAQPGEQQHIAQQIATQLGLQILQRGAGAAAGAAAVTAGSGARAPNDTVPTLADGSAGAQGVSSAPVAADAADSSTNSAAGASSGAEGTIVGGGSSSSTGRQRNQANGLPAFSEGSTSISSSVRTQDAGISSSGGSSTTSSSISGSAEPGISKQPSQHNQVDSTPM
eukprot:GHRR01019166.1.p1 GENE.GHRR01019166.1~~GHRR01019166.1.p1  ORF type:complete len:833 (+),score=340.80 GHRR01019166.1:350-2848(+)